MTEHAFREFWVTLGVSDCGHITPLGAVAMFIIAHIIRIVIEAIDSGGAK